MDRIKLTEDNILDFENAGVIIRLVVNESLPTSNQLKQQILEEHEIIQKLLDTANMDCYEKDERIRRDFAKKLLQEKL